MLTWVWTVTAGQTDRWTSKDVQIEDGGRVLAASWGLDVDEVDEGPTSATALAFTPPASISTGPGLAAYLSALREGMGELALAPVVDGVARMGDRRVVRRGRVEDVEYDPESDRVSVTLLGNELEDTGDLCPRTIERRTWPLHPEGSTGLRYPWVYGAPGSYIHEDYTDRDGHAEFTYNEDGWWTGVVLVIDRITHTSGATPAIPVDAAVLTMQIAPGITVPDPWPRYLLISDGWVDDGVTQVELWAQYGESATNWITTTEAPIIRGWDVTGAPVTLLDLSGLDDVYRRGGRWFVGWTGGEARPGRLGDLVLRVLQLATCPVDWASVRRAARYLNRYQLGGYVDKSVQPVEWVADRVKSLGATPVWSAAGFGLQVTDPAWTPPPAVRLEVGAGAEVSGPLRMTRPTVAGVEVSWAKSETTRTRVRSTVTVPGATGDRASTDLPEVWDPSTALAAAELALRVAGGARRVTLSTRTVDTWRVTIGDTVAFTWSDLGIEGETWRVVGARHTDDDVRTLVIERTDVVGVRGVTSAVES